MTNQQIAYLILRDKLTFTKNLTPYEWRELRRLKKENNK